MNNEELDLNGLMMGGYLGHKNIYLAHINYGIINSMNCYFLILEKLTSEKKDK